MNADRHAELRAVAEEGWDARSSSVIRLLDEIAELRRGLERVRDRDHSSIDEDMVAIGLGFGSNTCAWCDSVELAATTLNRADAIGGGT